MRHGRPCVPQVREANLDAGSSASLDLHRTVQLPRQEEDQLESQALRAARIDRLRQTHAIVSHRQEHFLRCRTLEVHPDHPGSVLRKGVLTRAASKTAGAAKKQIPMCSLQPWTCSQVQVLPRPWRVGPRSDILGPPNRDRNGEGSHDRGMSHQTNSDSQRGRGRGMYAQDVKAKKGR